MQLPPQADIELNGGTVVIVDTADGDVWAMPFTDIGGYSAENTEPLLELGRHLKLPPWLEPDREQIAAALPPLRLDAA